MTAPLPDGAPRKRQPIGEEKRRVYSFRTLQAGVDAIRAEAELEGLKESEMARVLIQEALHARHTKRARTSKT